MCPLCIHIQINLRNKLTLLTFKTSFLNILEIKFLN